MFSLMIMLLKAAFFLAGTVLIFTGLRLWVRYRGLTRRGTVTSGMVREIIISNHFDGLVLHFPVVEFITESGQSLRFKSSMGTNRPEYKAGDQVPVLYDKENPENAEIHSTSKFQKNSIILILAGLFFLIAGTIVHAHPGNEMSDLTKQEIVTQ